MRSCFQDVPSQPRIAPRRSSRQLATRDDSERQHSPRFAPGLSRRFSRNSCEPESIKHEEPRSPWGVYVETDPRAYILRDPKYLDTLRNERAPRLIEHDDRIRQQALDKEEKRLAKADAEGYEFDRGRMLARFNDPETMKKEGRPTYQDVDKYLGQHWNHVSAAEQEHLYHLVSG